MKLSGACSLANRCYWAFKAKGLKVIFSKLSDEFMTMEDDFTYDEFRKVLRAHLVEANRADLRS